jgi:hypothetical protein
MNHSIANNENNYLSDEEVDDEIEEMTFDEMYPEEELDDEVKDLIFKKTAKTTFDDLDFFTKSNDKKPTKIDYSKIVKDTIKIEPTKEIKKDTKRTFNPRLPPYLTIKKNNNINTLVVDEKTFPKLGAKK